MVLRSAGPPPLPSSELQRMKEQLSTHYGSEVFEEAGAKVLIVRVPGDHPDPVNDVENAVEYLAAGDVTGLTHCLLMGNRQTQAVYVQPLQQLMGHRIERDRQESARLREQLGEESFQVFRAKGDARQLPRLAIRLSQDSVATLEEGDLEWLVDSIGPELEAKRLKGVVAVHLIANQDDVRVDADAFLADIRRRYQDEDRKRVRQEELQRLAAEAEYKKEAERKSLVDELDKRLGRAGRSIVAPLKRMETGSWREGSSSSRGEGQRDSWRDSVASDVDEVVRSRAEGGRSETGRSETARSPGSFPGDGTTPRNLRDKPEPSSYQDMKGELKKGGFAIMEHPEVKGHTVDMAGERESGYPQRVIVRLLDRLTLELANELLATSRALEVDLTLAVAENIDPEAQKRLIATKVKWVRPQDISHLHL